MTVIYVVIISYYYLVSQFSYLSNIITNYIVSIITWIITKANDSAIQDFICISNDLVFDGNYNGYKVQQITLLTGFYVFSVCSHKIFGP